LYKSVKSANWVNLGGPDKIQYDGKTDAERCSLYSL